VSSRVRLTGSVTFNGPATTLRCTAGAPRIVTFDVGGSMYSALMSVPPPAAPGGHPLDASGPFVAVSHLVGGQEVWTSRNHSRATGTLNVGADGTVSARFRGLEPGGGGAAGTVDGEVESRCG